MPPNSRRASARSTLCLELLGQISGDIKKQESVNVSLEAPLIAPFLITQYVAMAKEGTFKILEESHDETAKVVNGDLDPGSSGPGN